MDGESVDIKQTTTNNSGLNIALDAMSEKLVKQIIATKSKNWNALLDYAENQAARQIRMKMVDWVQKLDAFLQFNESDIDKYRQGKQLCS